LIQRFLLMNSDDSGGFDHIIIDIEQGLHGFTCL
jgi:hypothetical protein